MSIDIDMDASLPENITLRLFASSIVIRDTQDNEMVLLSDPKSARQVAVALLLLADEMEQTQ